MISYWGVDHGDEISKMRTVKDPDERKHAINRPTYYNSRKQNAAIGGGLGAVGGGAYGLSVGGGRGAVLGAATGGAVGGAFGAGSLHRNSKNAEHARTAYKGAVGAHNAYAGRHNALRAQKKSGQIDRAGYKSGKQANMNRHDADIYRGASKYLKAVGGDKPSAFDFSRQKKG